MKHYQTRLVQESINKIHCIYRLKMKSYNHLKRCRKSHSQNSTSVHDINSSQNMNERKHHQYDKEYLGKV